MKARNVVMIFIIISCLVFAVGDYFFAMRDSYNRYVSGEYYFRYHAKTTEAPDAFEAYAANPDAPLPDYSDPRVVLLGSTNAKVYAYGPHDGVCTVIYGDHVFDDFPLYRLYFEDEEESKLFYGTKTYTYEEYIDVVNNLTKDQLNSDYVSDKAMANYNNVKDFLFILIGVDVLFGIIFFALIKSELEDKIDLLLIVAALYSIFWEVITFFIFTYWG